MIRCVTFVTPEYQDWVVPLAESCAAFGVDLRIVQKASTGSWVRNCAMKAAVVREALQANLGTGAMTLWLDADAVLLDRLEYLEAWAKGRVFDVAALMPTSSDRNRWPHVGSRLCSGTILWADTSSAYLAACEWEEACRAKPDELDQEVLYEVLNKEPEKRAFGLFAYLDPRFCHIPDLMPDVTNPVISHRQASRTMRPMLG
ncbi:MAG TPA: putative nucleotide-diphospho-sugar transferase [Phycisphaerales bacterium]|nr:putative nucleotide-diphospho-sugar transferase [Phycisphaerales bacterium]